MDEYILAPVLAGDEAEASRFVEPFDFAAQRNSRRRIGSPRAARRSEAEGRTDRSRLGGRRSVDFENAGDLGTSIASVDRHKDFGAGGRDLASRRLEDIDMQKGVPLASRQFDEAVAFLLIEPFYDAGDRLSALRRRRRRFREKGYSTVMANSPGSRPRRLSCAFVTVGAVPPGRRNFCLCS